MAGGFFLDGGEDGEMCETTVKDLIRPVRCHICKKMMYYSGDQRHEAEVFVKVFSDDAKDTFHAHVRCWNERMDLQ